MPNNKSTSIAPHLEDPERLKAFNEAVAEKEAAFYRCFLLGRELVKRLDCCEELVYPIEDLKEAVKDAEDNIERSLQIIRGAPLE